MRKSIAILIVFIILAGITSLFIGVIDISPLDLMRSDAEKTRVFLISRIPRTISIICVGMTLSVCGVIMQLVMSNKMVSPSTASTMDWARLGVLAAMLFFPAASVFVKMAIIAAFAFIGTLVFVRLIRLIPLKDTIFVPLLGMMLGNVISAIATFIAYRYDLIQNMSSWLQGSFAMILKGRYELLYLGIPVLILAVLFADQFTIASMGKDFSSNLGLSYETTVNIGLILVSIATAIVVGTIGTIPFIGLIIPNLVSMYRGDLLKKNIWEIALSGGLFLLLSDIFSRWVLYPFEIPIGVTVGIIGSILFLYLILRRKGLASA